MKGKTKSKLQLRFVLLSVSALIILQSVIVAFSLLRNYHNITAKADHMIILALKNSDLPEVAGARYFTVIYNFNNKTFEADLTHTALVHKESAIKYARSVLDKKKDRGYVDGYRYLVNRKKGSIQITFLSRFAAIEAYKSNCSTMIFVSIAGIIVMTILIIAVSRKVVEPIVKNQEKQKAFITSASHELKTPLTVINADAQLLESEIGENEWLTDIIKQTNRMNEMTHRLVFLSRAEEQEGNFVKIDFPISDLAEEITQSYRAVAQSCEKEYSIDIQKGITYCGDEKAIRELMTALMDNAFKYSTDKGSIKVKLIAEKKGVKFTVENTVSKINPEDIKNFTVRFYRANTSDKVKGFGIGLSIVQVVAEAHNGKLKVELSKKDTIIISVVLR